MMDLMFEVVSSAHDIEYTLRCSLSIHKRGVVWWALTSVKRADDSPSTPLIII